MNTKIVQLLAVLKQELTCYREMKTVLSDEETSISLAAREGFDQVQVEKESLVVRLQRHEEARMQLVGHLSARCAPDGKPMTVCQLARCVNPPYDQQLLDCADRLRATIGEVQETNRRNQLLINQFLGLVKGSLKMLTDLIEGSPVYTKPGTHQSAGFRSGGGRFIRGTV